MVLTIGNPAKRIRLETQSNLGAELPSTIQPGYHAFGPPALKKDRVFLGRDLRMTLHRDFPGRTRVVFPAIFAGMLGMGLVLALPGFSAAQPAKSFDPSPFGFDLPAGIVRQGKGVAVTTADAAGKPVVARLHVAIGSGAIVMLPDGELVARKVGEFAVTERKFEPIEKGVLAKRLDTTEFPGFKVKQTRHYIYVYNSSEEFFLGTSRILESMLPGVTAYAEAQKIEKVHPPEVPLVVVMFATEEEFQRHSRLPPGVVAYYHALSNRVFMYEQSRLLKVRPDLALSQAISTVAHEGAHQILHNIGVQQRLSVWPMWLSEGLAEFFAPTTVGKGLKWKGAGQVNDMRMFELEQYIKSRASEKPDGKLIEQTVGAARLTSTGYASAWSLTHYLAKNRRGEFAAYLRAISKTEPLEGALDVEPPGIVPANLDLFRKTFGDKFSDLENKLVTHLKKQPYTDPFLDAPHYVAALFIPSGKRGKREVQTFHSQLLADKWIRETIEKVPAEDRGRVEREIRRFPNRAAAETFANAWMEAR
jgi:Protein of unknown function (DUF1570)